MAVLGITGSGCTLEPTAEQVPVAVNVEAILSNGGIAPLLERTTSLTGSIVQLCGGGGCGCGGVLIAPKVVLSAAHCGNFAASVRADFWNGDPATSTTGYVSVPVAACSPHPRANFVPPANCGAAALAQINNAHDLIVLRLASDFVQAVSQSTTANWPVVQPIPLAKPTSCVAWTPTPIRQYGYGGALPSIHFLTSAPGSANVNEYGILKVRVLAGQGLQFEHGDSGGPTLDANNHVLGIFSAFDGLDRDHGDFAHLFQTMVQTPQPNVIWILQALDVFDDCRIGATPGQCKLPGMTVAMPDSDTDGLPDDFDYCPNLAIGTACATDGWNHCDEDGDFVGDECDECASDDILEPNRPDRSCDHADDDGDSIPNGCDPCPYGPDPRITPAFPRDADPDGDGIANECDSCPHTQPAAGPLCDGRHCDDDGDGVGNECDICPAVADPHQDNCNFDVEHKFNAPALGDACDPVPCGETSITEELTSPREFESRTRTRISVDARTALIGAAELRTGTRFCRCAAASGTRSDTPEVRQECENPQPDNTGGCVLAQPQSYDRDFESNPWRSMTLTGEQGDIVEVVGAGPQREMVVPYEPFTGTFEPNLLATWEVNQDVTRWDGLGLDDDMPPLAPFNESLPRQAPGLVWTHTPGPADSDFISDVRPATSHYWSGLVSTPQAFPNPPRCLAGPSLRLLPDFGPCLACRSLFPQARLGAVGQIVSLSGGRTGCAPWEPPVQFAVQLPRGYLDGPLVNPAVVQLMTELAFDPARYWVMPAEPPSWLAGDGIRYVALGRDGAFGGIALSQVAGDLAAMQLSVVGAVPPAQRTQPLAVLSANRQTLWMGGGVSSSGAAFRDLWALDLNTARWRNLELPWIPRPQRVLAATYSAAADVLWVLDEYGHAIDTNTAPDTQCARKEFGGHVYWACRYDRKWADARAKCTAKGMDLATIESQAEADYLADAITSDSWIGANDQSVEGTWVWARSGLPFWVGEEDGSPVSGRYVDWENGDPDSWEDCAELNEHSGTFDSKSCTSYKEFLCESESLVRLSSYRPLGGFLDGASEVAVWPRRTANARYALAAGPGGELYVAASQDGVGGHTVLRLTAPPTGPATVSGVSRRAGAVVDGSIGTDTSGVGVFVIAPGGSSIEGHLAEDFSTSGLQQAPALVF